MQQHHLKALFVIRDNVRTLLAVRKESQTDLARYCGHDKSWINKFLNEGRGLQLADLDKIAAYFGIEPYQLFQPGIGRLTERRKGEDRRTGAERRIGHSGRLVRHLQSEAGKFPRFARQADYDRGALPAEVRAIMERADREIAAYETKVAGRQVASPRRKVAGAPEGRRGVRGSGSETD